MVRYPCPLAEIPLMFQTQMWKQTCEVQMECDAGTDRLVIWRTNSDMRIAVIYICTGNYSVFWEGFYQSSQQYFYPEIEKDYYVFTDDDKLIRSGWATSHIFTYFQRKAGWPYDTLMRFNLFSIIQDRLKQYDYCYFWNANAMFVRRIDESVIPFPNEERNVLLWRHTWAYDDEYAQSFDPEPNPKSEAFYPKGDYCHDYGGGFFGGTSAGFIKMSLTLRDRIARDLSKGIIALWHDQSHILKYGTEIIPMEVPKDVVVSEEYCEGRNPYVIFLDKHKFGGMYKLRGMSKGFILKQKFMDCANRVATILGVKPLIGKLKKIGLNDK